LRFRGLRLGLIGELSVLKPTMNWWTCT
jgi:hypothetical protein